jgi:hypothetical protein
MVSSITEICVVNLKHIEISWMIVLEKPIHLRRRELQLSRPLTSVTIGALIPVGVLSTEVKLTFSMKDNDEIRIWLD